MPSDFSEDPERQRLWIQLAMFDETAVNEALGRRADADKDFVPAFIAWHGTANRNVQAERGAILSHEAAEGSELVRGS